MPEPKADIGAIALEDDGIYAWLGCLDDNYQVVRESSRRFVKWDPNVYSLVQAQKVIRDLVQDPLWQSTRAIGFSSFGQVNRRDYELTSLPRKEWENGGRPLFIPFDSIVDRARRDLGLKPIPIVVEHDVTVCALAEKQIDVHRPPTSFQDDLPDNDGQSPNDEIFAYIRLGAGVGVEILRNGEPLHASRHSEGGHIPVVVHKDDPLRESTCTAHPQCLEGRLSRASFEQRGFSPQKATWLIGEYLGQLTTTLTMCNMCTMIVVAGQGMMLQDGKPDEARYRSLRDGRRTD
jgi:predicted NBD/HSP70 family sugar kinase